MAVSNKNSKASVTKKEKQESALKLRLKGMPYSAIGKEIGCTKQHAHRLVAAAIKEVDERIGEEAKNVKQMELLRLDKMFFEASKIMIDSTKELNKLAAIDRMNRIMERRAKMLSLDEVRETINEEIDEEFL